VEKRIGLKIGVFTLTLGENADFCGNMVVELSVSGRDTDAHLGRRPDNGKVSNRTWEGPRCIIATLQCNACNAVQ
jgi:hypothetical protein